MKGRIVDAALLLGLFIAAGAIVGMLLTLGRAPGPSRPASGPPAGVTGEGPSAGIVPLAPDTGPASGVQDDGAGVLTEGAAGDAVDALDATATADTANAEESTTADGTAVADDRRAEVGEADGAAPGGGAADVAEGEDSSTEPRVSDVESVALDRIGFSFAPGGSGACGVELEAWRHVAVSRELLAEYGCGAEVFVSFDDPIAGRASATLIVADTMNASWSRTVNVYVSPEEPAFAYGLTTGTVAPTLP